MTVASTPHLYKTGTVITAATLIAIAFATLLPQPPAAPRSHLCLACGMFGGVNGLLNVLLFMPLGVGLAMRGSSAKRAILFALALSVLIETAQLWIPGRYSNIGDVITNTLGGALGFAIVASTQSWLFPSASVATVLLVCWGAIWLSVQAGASFAFRPFIPTSSFYGQLAHDLGHFAVFRGRILTATIGDIALPDARVSDADSIGNRLQRGAVVATTVVPAAPTSDIAPIVRVADIKRREIVLLAQDGTELVFGVRTGAALLRLRPPFFAMRRAFTASPIETSPAADTIRLTAKYDGRAALLTAQSKSTADATRLPVSTSLGWTLVWPDEWLIENTFAEHALSWIWISALTLPFGYWGARAGGSADQRATRGAMLRLGAIAVAVITLGLVVVPHALNPTTTPLRDFLAAMTGILAGAALAMWPRRVGS